MKQIICALVLGVLAPVFVPAQTPAKSAKKPVASSAKTTPSARDLNLEAYTQLLRTDLNKSRSQIIAQVMQFDTDQAAVFWPIYKDFQAEYAKVGDQIVELVHNYVLNYDTMTDEVADQLVNKLLDIDQQRTDLKRKYYEKLKTALDAVTAARFLQVENQIEKLVDLQIASQLPVVGQSEK